MAIFQNMTREDFEDPNKFNAKVQETKTEIDELRKKWDDIEKNVDILYGGAATRYREMQKRVKEQGEELSKDEYRMRFVPQKNIVLTLNEGNALREKKAPCGWATLAETEGYYDFNENNEKILKGKIVVHPGSYKRIHRLQFIRPKSEGVDYKFRKQLMREIVVDDGTKSLAEQICEWNHKAENVATLNDWVSLQDMDYYCEYYWKTHRMEPLPKFDIFGGFDAGKVRSYLDITEEEREQLNAGMEHKLTGESHKWYYSEGYARRGEILEGCLRHVAQPFFKDDYQAYLMGMRIAQQMPVSQCGYGDLDKLRKEDNEMYLNMVPEDTVIDTNPSTWQPIRPCWSYRIDPDEHIRARVSEFSYRDVNYTSKGGLCDYTLYLEDVDNIMNYRNSKRVDLEKCDAFTDPKPHMPMPDYGWKLELGAFHQDCGWEYLVETDGTVFENRALLEELSANDDFDMLTGFSKSTGKQLYPRYYDNNGNPTEYKFYPPSPWWGKYMLRTGQIAQDVIAEMERENREDYESYKKECAMLGEKPHPYMSLDDWNKKHDREEEEYKQAILDGKTNAMKKYDKIEVSEYSLEDLEIAIKLECQGIFIWEEMQALGPKIDWSRKPIWDEIIQKIKNGEIDPCAYPILPWTSLGEN